MTELLYAQSGSSSIVRRVDLDNAGFDDQDRRPVGDRRAMFGVTMKWLSMQCGMVLAVLVGVMAVFAGPASASTTQISGVGVFVPSCGDTPAGYDSLQPIKMSGSLTGCWYTKIESSKDNGAPSGVYLETGREIFIGSLNGGPVGQFGTTYRFEAKYNPDVLTGAEVKGRCQHPIAAGSGGGGFASATGRVDFKDDVATGELLYRGHIQLP